MKCESEVDLSLVTVRDLNQDERKSQKVHKHMNMQIFCHLKFSFQMNMFDM